MYSDRLPFKSSHSRVYEIIIHRREKRLVQIEYGGKNVA